MLSKKLHSLQIHYVSSSIYDLQMTIITGHCILLKLVIFSRFYCLTYKFDYAIKPNYISHECRPHTNKKTDWARSLFYCNIENIKECNLNQINASLSPPFVCFFISYNTYKELEQKQQLNSLLRIFWYAHILSKVSENKSISHVCNDEDYYCNVLYVAECLQVYDERKHLKLLLNMMSNVESSKHVCCKDYEARQGRLFELF